MGALAKTNNSSQTNSPRETSAAVLLKGPCYPRKFPLRDFGRTLNVPTQPGKMEAFLREVTRPALCHCRTKIAVPSRSLAAV
jgi:hypothetical protein